MARQEKSWVSPQGVPECPGLVGQVFSPFNSDDLDKDDRGMPADLAGCYQTLLMGNRIEYVGTKGESVQGNEAKQSRKVVTVPVTHRVNAVEIRTESSSKKGIGYEVSASNSYVTYEWGPPQPSVTVTWTTNAKDLNTGGETRTTKTRTLP